MSIALLSLDVVFRFEHLTRFKLFDLFGVNIVVSFLNLKAAVGRSLKASIAYSNSTAVV